MPHPGIGGNSGRTEVEVEPVKAVGGSTNWVIQKNGYNHDREQYKDNAVKKARKLARSEGGTLTVYNRDFDVSEQNEY